MDNLQASRTKFTPYLPKRFGCHVQILGLPKSKFWQASSTSCYLNEIQSTFSQCIMLVPNFFYALWHSMQDEMCHKAWLSMTSAKNVTLRKSLGKTGKYCVFTWYQHSWERDYYWKKNWEKFVWLSSLEQCGAVPISRNLKAFVHTQSIPQICNFGQGPAYDSPKMEACCKLKFWLQYTKSILG